MTFKATMQGLSVVFLILMVLTVGCIGTHYNLPFLGPIFGLCAGYGYSKLVKRLWGWY